MLAAVLPSPNKWRVDPPGPYVQQRARQIMGRMNTVGGEGSTNRDWRPSWHDVTCDLGEAFTHRQPTTSTSKCWNHVPRRDMVAVFTWRPRGDNQYFLPAPIKRYIDGA